MPLCKSQVLVDVVCCSSAITCCQRASQWAHALHILASARSESLVPDMYSFSAAITAQQQWRWALLIKPAAMNQVVLSSVISSCEKGRQWQLALLTLHQAPLERLVPDVFSRSAAISACDWRLALGILRSQHLPSEVVCSAAIHACSQSGRWEWAVALLRAMRRQRLRPGLIARNAVLHSLAQAKRWEAALAALLRLDRPDEVSFGCVISACEKATQWPAALAVLTLMRSFTIRANEVCFGSAISACEKGSRWEPALRLLAAAEAAEAKADAAAVNAAISACEVCGELKRALSLLYDSEMSADGDRRRSGATFAWALARLEVREPLVLHAALVEATSSPHELPGEVAKLWWAAAMMGAEGPRLQQLAAATQQLSSFTSQELLMTAWGASSIAPGVLAYVQEEWIQRLLTLSLSDLEPQCLLGILWACNFVGCARFKFLAAVRGALSRWGRARDMGAEALQGWSSGGGFYGPTAGAAVLMDAVDRVALFKPPGWEVEGHEHGKSLQAFLIKSQGMRPILQDASATFGFLHRLDVPSSGLILAARTYEAYYDLRVQLASGEVLREYNALCHGWFHGVPREVTARVYWRGGAPSKSSGQGKPSRSQVRPVASGHLRASGVTIAAVRIATGRRHQIRVHLAYTGHPTLHDALYSSAATFELDGAFLSRNALHRYRLRFRDLRGTLQDLKVHPPEDFLKLLLSIKPKDKDLRDICQYPLTTQRGFDLIAF
ncbi:unnamed protein product [Effrenium voratum]|nr:unnamed protein product [Effrenium voratum]